MGSGNVEVELIDIGEVHRKQEVTCHAEISKDTLVDMDL